MKTIAAVLCCVFLFGCSSSQIENNNITSPELIQESPLPPIPLSLYKTPFVLDLNLYILEDGSVNEVVIRNNIGDQQWLALAKETIMKWKYTPALSDNKPVSTWISQKAIVQVEDPVFYTLAEIEFDSVDTAEYVYKMLQDNKDFESLAQRYSVVPSGKVGGILGKVNVMVYPQNIRNEILKMSYNDFTEPLKYGNRYVIFKRLEILE
jgi:PPIC-type PPIASE domain/Gram-negative bacterial TonB protein C-terminal